MSGKQLRLQALPLPLVILALLEDLLPMRGRGQHHLGAGHHVGNCQETFGRRKPPIFPSLFLYLVGNVGKAIRQVDFHDLSRNARDDINIVTRFRQPWSDLHHGTRRRTHLAGCYNPCMAIVQVPIWKKSLFATVVAAAFFIGLEAVLSLVGVRPAAVSEDPLVGFSGTLPLFVPDESSSTAAHMVTAPNKLGLFNRQQFANPKPKGTFRVFCLGGSTCYGHPYDDRTSFAGWLRELLPCVDDSRRWEVINAGGVSYASYREAALVEELGQYEPDLFILFTGHNEFLEERTYGDLRTLPSAVKDASGLLARTRTYTALRQLLAPRPPAVTRTMLPAEVDAVLDHSVGPSAYHRNEPLKRQIVEHFEFNLRRIAGLARAAGADVLFITPVSNLKDCSPFKSEHRAGQSASQREQWSEHFQRGRSMQATGDLPAALSEWDACLAIDDQYAEVHYRRGQCLFALDRFDEARTAFVRARDEDICPLRAITPLVEAVRRAAVGADVPLIDFEQRLMRHCQQQFQQAIPGRELFLDHVHPTIEVNGLVARAVLEELLKRGTVHADASWHNRCWTAVSEKVESQLTPEDRAVGQRMIAKVFSWAGKLEEAGPAALAALKVLPEDRESLFIAGAYEKLLGHDRTGNEYYRQALETEVKENPRDVEARQFLAKTLIELGEPDAARQQLREALRLRPESAEARQLFEKLGTPQSGKSGKSVRP